MLKEGGIVMFSPFHSGPFVSQKTWKQVCDILYVQYILSQYVRGWKRQCSNRFYGLFGVISIESFLQLHTGSNQKQSHMTRGKDTSFPVSLLTPGGRTATSGLFSRISFCVTAVLAFVWASCFHLVLNPGSTDLQPESMSFVMNPSTSPVFVYLKLNTQ